MREIMDSTIVKTGTNRQRSLEDTLWDAADKLRGNLEAAEYKHVVLGLVFLKYVSDAFETRRKELESAIADPQSSEYIKNDERRSNILESRDEYTSENVFWVPAEARWTFLQDKAKLPDIGVLIDKAMDAIEKENPSLSGVLPKTYARAEIDKRLIGELVDLIGTIGFTEVDHGADDVLGRVYEYFLGKFAAAEGRGAGEFYTPRSVVRLLVEMLEPYHGRVYDPCCGSGGMFVQSSDFVSAHGGRRSDISVYGQEYVAATWRLAKMNLALRGIDANLADEPADTFHANKHADLRADYIIANPPFNMKDWGGESLVDDPRWRFGVPPNSNANMAWVQHFIYHLAPKGTAGFVLANGSLATNQAGEGLIRQKIVEADLIDCIVSLPAQLFFSTQIAVSLWFIARDKGQWSDKQGRTSGLRTGRSLFIDARGLGHMRDRTHKDFSDEDVTRIADAYKSWRAQDGTYEDTPGFCAEATVDEIKLHRYALVPGRYVGFAERPTPGEIDTGRFVSDLASISDQIGLVAQLSQDAARVLKEVFHG
jgi:type I restriction enzyme M protein